jgi:DNA-binding transcriptional MerR regulator
MNSQFTANIDIPVDQLPRGAKKSFSIRELEKLSGVKAHTLRIWEQRYQMFAPGRSNGNVRSYSLQDVQRLLNVALLLKKGCKISILSNLSASELRQKLQTVLSEEDRQCKAINHLIFYMYADIEKFEDVLDGCVQCWGIDATLEKVILPFMEKVGLLSYIDKNYETHFVVTAIRRKIIFGIEKAVTATANNKTALLFLPEGEHYDLFLLYLSYTLKKAGIRVFYLGTDISISNLRLIMDAKPVDFLFTYIPLKQKFKLQGFASYLKQKFPLLSLNAITCEDVSDKDETSNVNLIHYKLSKSFIASQLKYEGQRLPMFE